MLRNFLKTGMHFALWRGFKKSSHVRAEIQAHPLKKKKKTACDPILFSSLLMHQQSSKQKTNNLYSLSQSVWKLKKK